MSELIDHHYPTPEALRQIRDFKGAPLTLAYLVAELLEDMGYGRCVWADYDGEAAEFAYTTGGWSGCEEVLSELEKTMFHLSFWESTHRGGRVVYRIPEDRIMREGFWGSYV